jgi:hypothetical protein
VAARGTNAKFHWHDPRGSVQKRRDAKRATAPPVKSAPKKGSDGTTRVRITAKRHPGQKPGKAARAAAKLPLPSDANAEDG